MTVDRGETTYRGRFAPSPTGRLHLGSAAAALVAWLAARRAGGRFILRVEDIDTPRVVLGSAAQQLDDLRWLGIDWDEGPDVGGPAGPYTQSERSARYEASLDELTRRGLVYLCDCSRAETRLASAPHAGEDGARYSGRCRAVGVEERRWKRPPALRLALPDREVTIHDRWQGTVAQNVWREIGDFVLKRGDGVYAYQLAVVVDDLAMGVTEVVRGADLLSSAPRQALLAELLGAPPLRFAHLPLVLSHDGSRLAKRARGVAIADHRDAGRSPDELIGVLAGALGLLPVEDPPRVVSARDLVGIADLEALRGRATVQLPRLLLGRAGERPG